MIHTLSLLGMFVVVGLVFWGLFQEWRDEQFGEVWQAADWPLRDAMDLARFTGHPEADHFEDVLGMVEIGSGAKRQVTDIRPPRYA